MKLLRKRVILKKLLIIQSHIDQENNEKCSLYIKSKTLLHEI